MTDNSIKFYFILLFILSNQFVFSQLKVIDSTNGEPIAFAHFIVEEGKLGTSSDINGIVSMTEIEKKIKDPTSKVTIQHIAYDNFEISFQELKMLSTIYLKERNIKLQELIITPSRKCDYIVFKGYFRSYQLENGVPKYFTDGIVEYYVPQKGNNFKFRILEYRSFRNQVLIDQLIKRKTTIVMKLAGVPYIESGALIDDLNKKFTYKDIIDGREIQKNKFKVGYVKLNAKKGIVQISIDRIMPKIEEIHSIFGYTSRIRNIEITENYISNNILEITKDKLESRKEYRKIFFKHKKDLSEIEIDGIHEFYVMEKRYINKEDIKGIKLTSDTSLKESHSYSYEYWNDLGKFKIPLLSKQIENELGKMLIMY
ncbi:MAG: hypothetical protein PHT07_18140 [Paludibacter sp.]|nr:hypothetical protein [Paludibacter sp.]